VANILGNIYLPIPEDWNKIIPICEDWSKIIGNF
jgi:hypothetical protein